MSDGIFRKKENFTIVKNSVARDPDLSLKAKGLYLTIQANITMPNKSFHKSDFLRMCKDGEKSFSRAWNELKERGLLKVHIFPRGNRFKTEYELLDKAREGPHTFYYKANGDVSMTNLEKEKVSHDNLEEFSDDLRAPHLGSYVKGNNDLGSTAKGADNNNTYYKTINNTKVDFCSMELKEVKKMKFHMQDD